MTPIHFRRYLDCFPLYWQTALVCRSAIPFLNHLYRRPLRRRAELGLSQEEMRRSKRAAMYDMMFDELLKGYCQLSHRKLHPDTAQMLYLLRRLAREHDDEFERRTTSGESLERDAVLQAPAVQACRERFTRFVAKTCDPEIILGYLRDLFAQYYQPHLHSWEAARQAPTPKGVLQVLELDSGLQLRATLDCVALFNAHPLESRIQREFHHLGMAGKLANDLTDLGFDTQDQVPNFMHAVLLQYADEWKTAQAAGLRAGSLGRTWWLKNCPVSTLEFFGQVEFHYTQITSLKLRICCDLMVWPTIAGFDYKNKRRAHA